MADIRDYRFVDEAAIAELVRQAHASPRKRSHLLLHAGHDDQVQRLVIALQPGTYVRPHHHSEQWEMLVVLQGRARLLSFDASGALQASTELSPSSPIAQIPVGAWHGFVVGEPATVVMEIKPGPFRANEFADWAPPEGDAQAANYLETLVNAVSGAARS